MVGNDNEIECHKLCMGVVVRVQGQNFTVDFHVLPLRGVDLVLGVQWLKSLRPILIDYNDLTMKFLHTGRVIKLKGRPRQ